VLNLVFTPKKIREEKEKKQRAAHLREIEHTVDEP